MSKARVFKEGLVMLAKLFGIVLLIIGGIVAFGVLMALVGTIVGIVIFLLKLAVPVVLVYVGYRLITKDRHRTVY